MDARPHERVDVAVGIEVAPLGDGAKGVLDRVPCSLYLDKASVALVLIQLVCDIGGNEQVEITVVIQVGRSNDSRHHPKGVVVSACMQQRLEAPP